MISEELQEWIKPRSGAWLEAILMLDGLPDSKGRISFATGSVEASFRPTSGECPHNPIPQGVLRVLERPQAIPTFGGRECGGKHFHVFLAPVKRDQERLDLPAWTA